MKPLLNNKNPLLVKQTKGISMTRYQTMFRPLITALGVLAVLLAASGLLGCSSTQTTQATCATTCADKFEQDRQAILGMAGEYGVSFDFKETVALRDGYELKKPYHSQANELVVVIADTGEFISMQHLLVVSHGEKVHVVKHWRQDWQYQSTAGFDFRGDNVWDAVDYDPADVAGKWVQSVYQVDDSPRYWGAGAWIHRDGVSTWTSGATNRPLPRREFSKRSDYQIMGAINTHVVTCDGWMHYQSNHKLDKNHPTDPVIALESGVNTYVKTADFDFSKAKEYWQKTAPYWAQVRAAWAPVYSQRTTIKLKNKWKGDPMYTHIFDLADLYWGQDNVAEARTQINEVIEAFLEREAVALP